MDYSDTSLSATSWKTADEVTLAALSPDGTRLAIGHGEGRLTVYSTETGRQLLNTMFVSGLYFIILGFSPNNRLIGTAAEARTAPATNVEIWDAKTGRRCFNLSHGEYVFTATFSCDSCLLISGGYERALRLWDTNTGKQTTASPVDVGKRIWSISCSPDGTKLAVACGKDMTEIYDTSNWQRLHSLEDGSYHSFVSFSPNSRYIFINSISDNKHITVWDTTTAEKLDIRLDVTAEGNVESLSFSPDSHVVAGIVAGTIRIWDVGTGALRYNPIDSPMGYKWIWHFPDGRRLIAGSTDGTVQIWEVQDDNEYLQPQIQSQKPEPESIVIKTLQDVIFHLRLRGCPDMTTQLDPSTGGEYPISSGGFGDIYRCKLTNGTEVAVKTVRLYVGSVDQDKKHLKHAAQELYAWSKCKHVNVQPLLGLTMFRGQIGMVAEWESNGSMPEYIERHPGADRCILSTSITEGLLYLHKSGVVHGDLKGANVLISKEGVPRLADFGNAKLQEYTMKFTKSSTKETVSSRWAAPELFEGGWCTFKTDVYALGMTILEAITGNMPWPDLSERSVIFAVTIKKAHPERPEAHIPTYSERGDILWSLLKECWESDPESRPDVEQVRNIMKTVTSEGLRSIEVDMNDMEVD
ncbi:Tyrosine-protein kinase SPK-1 [Ceratobasidium sp. AG-Ba]|nr:Tyrosine-protein kinase SPK-1 [Ceratobasidium sp. AG-Ba]